MPNSSSNKQIVKGKHWITDDDDDDEDSNDNDNNQTQIENLWIFQSLFT